MKNLNLFKVQLLLFVLLFSGKFIAKAIPPDNRFKKQRPIEISIEYGTIHSEDSSVLFVINVHSKAAIVRVTWKNNSGGSGQHEIKTSNLTQATLSFPLKIKPGNNIYVFTAIDIKNNRASVSSEGYDYSKLQDKPVPARVLPATPTSVKANKTWVKIGDQIWSIKNLNDSRFRNGDPIPEAKTAGEWERAGNNQQPAWCYYNNDPKIGKEFGKLYNWYAVNDPRGLAPILWHVATDAEWTRLTTYLGGEDMAGKKMKSKYWIDDDGTNESGFEGLPGGFRGYNGLFEDIEYRGIWWCPKEGEYTLRALEIFDSGVNFGSSPNKKFGYSVRCIKD